MTVSSSTDRATFPGNGVTTVFPLPFRFLANTDVQAWLIDSATGELSPLSLGIHYTLIGAGEPEQDGSPVSQLTMLVAPGAGQSLFVQRVMEALQPTDIVNQGRFFPEVHELVFDRLTMLVQQYDGMLDRALKVRASDPAPADLPDAASRAKKILSFDVNGNPQAIDAAQDSSLALRNDLADPAKGAGLIGFNQAGLYEAGTVGRELSIRSQLSVPSVAALLSLDTDRLSNGDSVAVESYHPAIGRGAGVWVWRPSLDGGAHNGGTVISKSKTFPDWGDLVEQAAWYEPGQGSGCFLLNGSSVSVDQFGAIADYDAVHQTGTNNARAFAAFGGVAAASLRRIVPVGNYLVDGGIRIEMLDGSDVDWQGYLTGQDGVEFYSDTVVSGCRIGAVRIQTPDQYNWSGNTGVMLTNLYASEIHLAEVVGFERNVVCLGKNANGMAGNLVYLGRIRNARVSLLLTSEDTGWCNENTFFAGGFAFGSDITAEFKSQCVHLKTENGHTTCNNNRFVSPGFEASVGQDWKAFEIEGESNVILYPRLEGANRGEFKVDSQQCRLVSAFTVIEDNIVDDGYLNQIDTDIWMHRKGVSDKGVIRATNRSGAFAPAFAAHSTSGIRGSYLASDGVGIGYNEAPPMILAGFGAPEGSIAAPVGSLYMRTAEGQPNLYSKTSGTGNTGWAAK